MKKLFVISLVIIFGVIISDCYAKKPKKAKLTDEEIKAKMDSLRMEYEKEKYEKSFWKVVYFDTIKIDSVTEIPIYVDYYHQRTMPMPRIMCYNPVDYIRFAFYDTDKDRYYCATGRGEANTYGEASRMALIDAVMKIRKVAGDSVKLGDAELLMEKEDMGIALMKEQLLLEGDTSALSLIQKEENIRKVEVAIRIQKKSYINGGSRKAK